MHADGRDHHILFCVYDTDIVRFSIRDVNLVLPRIRRDGARLFADRDRLNDIERENINHTDCVAASVRDVDVFVIRIFLLVERLLRAAV